MNRYALPMTAALLVLASLGSHAQPACLMEGTMQLSSQTLRLKDCMVNRGLPPEDFKRICRSLVQSNANLGAEGQVTRVDACPARPQAICKGLGGKPIDAYYYERSAEDIKTGEDGCTKLGGIWQVGTAR